MTLRESYEYALVECNKLKAPSILLEDYIYLFNKAIQQYINTVYNRCEYDQQSSDDLRWLQAQHIIKNTETDPEQISEDATVSPMGNIWKVELPNDYMHLLNCIAQFAEESRCGLGVKTVNSPCRRLTSDLYPGILSNYYLKPTHKRPYYYLVNNSGEMSDDDVAKEDPSLEWMKESGDRTSNQSTVNLEIHVGSSDAKLTQVFVTYLKSPKYYSMDQEELYSLEDTTPVLEFPDYVCYEIINIYTRLLLENAGDPRLQTHIPINQTIQSGQPLK